MSFAHPATAAYVRVPELMTEVFVPRAHGRSARRLTYRSRRVPVEGQGPVPVRLRA